MAQSEANPELNPLLMLSTTLANAVEQAGQAVVVINARPRFSASGVHWQPGIIVTVDHAVRRDEEVSVTLPQGQTVAANLVGRDPGTDLAVLRLTGTDFPVAHVGDSAGLQVGHLVLAIARSIDSGLSASFGVISALGGAWRTWHGGQIDQLIRPDLSLYPGFSGGPLVNTAGEVVGLNTTGRRSGAVTIPTTTIHRVVNQLLRQGRIARGYLGVGMQPVQLPDRLQQTLQLSSNGGVIVVSLEANGPADQAGVLIGDILVALGGTPVSDIAGVHAMLDPDRVGKPLSLQLVRGGQLIELTATIGERPRREDP